MIGVSIRIELLGNNGVAVFRKPMISLIPVRSYLRIWLDSFLRCFDQRLAFEDSPPRSAEVLRTTQRIDLNGNDTRPFIRSTTSFASFIRRSKVRVIDLHYLRK